LKSNSSTYELTQIIIQTINEKEPESLAQLIYFVKQKLPVSEATILKVILKLESQGKIKLDNPTLSISANLSTYIKTPQVTWYWATIATAIIIVITFFLVPENSYPFSYLRNAFAIAFIFYLPGNTCIKALFPVTIPIKSTSENMESIERTALSLGMSLAITPIVGLILNYTPFGIRLASITISLFILTVAFATIGLFREFNAKSTAAKSIPEISSQT
jgi:uncharacterized membrane protein